MKIKNLVFAIVLLFVSAASVNAQSYKKIKPAFKKGRLDAQFGIGLTPTFIADKAKMVTPPLSLSLDYMVSKKFSIGAYAAHSITESNPVLFLDGIPGQWRVGFTEIGLRLGFHYTDFEKWDFYGGVNPNIKRTTNEDMLEGMELINKHKRIEPVNTSFSFGGFVGVRYAAKEKISIFSEAGTGASLLKVGVGFRIL